MPDLGSTIASPRKGGEIGRRLPAEAKALGSRGASCAAFLLCPPSGSAHPAWWSSLKSMIATSLSKAFSFQLARYSARPALLPLQEAKEPHHMATSLTPLGLEHTSRTRENTPS